MAGYIGLLRKQTELRVHQEVSPPRGEVALWDSILHPRGARVTPWNPDVLQQKKAGLRIYDQMKRDAVISCCQELKKLAVLCSGWAIVPASKDTADQEPADFVTEALNELPGTLGGIIRRILSGMDYGFSITEKIWQPIQEGEFKGKWGLKDLKTRKPHRFDFDVDEFGNIRPNGLWQDNGNYKYDPEKFVIYSHNMEFSNWYGESDFRKIYTHWWSKDNLTKFWNVFLERFSMGIPFLHPAEGKAVINDPAFTSLKNAITNLQFTSAIATQSSDAQIDILEAKRRGAGEYDAAIAYHDRSISRGLLVPTGLGFSEDEVGGSLARSRKHFDMWVMVIEDLRSTVEELLEEQLIRRLVDYNYTVKKYPRFQFEALSQEETGVLAKLWLDAIAGKAVHPTAEDENRFRVMVDFPERDEDELTDEIEESKAVPPQLPGLPAQPIEIRQPRKALPAPAAKEQPNKDELADEKKQKFVALAQEFYAVAAGRDLTKFEKKVDFAQVENDLDNLEDEARDRLLEILNRQREKVLAAIKKKSSEGAFDMSWINSFSIPYGVLTTATLKDFMRSAFDLGRDDAVSEIGKSQVKEHAKRPFPKLPPLSIIKQLQGLAFWIKGVLFDGLTKKIQGLLISAHESGEGTSETLMKVRDAYSPYIGDEQVVRDQRQIEPYRIETLIRTNATRAYNRGRMSEYRDPKLQGYVRGIQLSAILDERTTDICRAADHAIILEGDPMADRLLPPLHFNCRTIAVPVTAADGEFEPTSQEKLNHILTLMPPDFGGNVDKR